MASSREFLFIVREGVLGTILATPTPGTDSVYVRLTEGNSFSMAAAPVHEMIPYGGGLAITADVVSDHYACKGQLKTKLYPAQAKFFTSWATDRINAAQTTPWVTTEPPGDLGSCSVYHGIQYSDGTFLRKRFSGVKVTSFGFEVSRQSTVASLTLGLQGCRSYGNAMDSSADPDATEFPAPTDSSFPSGPFTFKQTGGLLVCRSSGSAVRSLYESLSVQIQNAVDGRWFEASYLQLNQFCGRSMTVEADLFFKPTPDDRSALEALTAQVVIVGLNNGVSGQHLTMTCNSKNIVTELPYDLPLDKAFVQKLKLQSVYDLAASEDFHVAYT